MPNSNKKIMELIGKKVSGFTVLEVSGVDKFKSWTYRCKCTCGNFKLVRSHVIRKENYIFCICKLKAKVNCKTNSNLYNIWANVKQRCFNKNSKDYCRYGGRGITMYEPWKNDFNLFRSYFIERPSPLHSIDRIDNYGNYEPGNCKWATPKEQSSNTRQNVFYEFNGIKSTQSNWANYFNVCSGTIRYRINKYGLKEAFEKLLINKNMRKI